MDLFYFLGPYSYFNAVSATPNQGCLLGPYFTKSWVLFLSLKVPLSFSISVIGVCNPIVSEAKNLKTKFNPEIFCK